MVIIKGKEIDNLYEGCLWLRKIWFDKPYNIWYEKSDNKDIEYYEHIYIEPIRGYGDESWVIDDINELKEFIDTH